MSSAAKGKSVVFAVGTTDGWGAEVEGWGDAMVPGASGEATLEAGPVDPQAAASIAVAKAKATRLRPRVVWDKLDLPGASSQATALPRDHRRGGQTERIGSHFVLVDTKPTPLEDHS
jgi:hypothetical protein